MAGIVAKRFWALLPSERPVAARGAGFGRIMSD